MAGINLGEAREEKFHYLYSHYLNLNSSQEVEPSREYNIPFSALELFIFFIVQNMYSALQ